MNYTAPIMEQRFVLAHVTRIGELIGSGLFADADGSTVDAVLDGAAAFAEGMFAPLATACDVVGARWSGGAVTLPDGCRAAYAAFVEGGWGGVSAPSAAGGQGLPLSLGTAVLEDLAGANLGLSLVAMLTPGAVLALEAHGSPEQRERWLLRLARGEWTGTMNLTEPQAGTDVGTVRTSATPRGDGNYTIKGQKIYITFGEQDLADNIVHLVLARTPGAPPGTNGLSLFLVPKRGLEADGALAEDNDVRCLKIDHKLGIHASPTCVMADGCAGELIGAEGGGIRAMFTMMNDALLAVANQGLQVVEATGQRAVAYALDRVQSARADSSSGGRAVPIIEHPDVRRMVLRMNAMTQGARWLLYYAAGQADRARAGDAAARARLDFLTPLTKSYCSDIGCEVASIGIQVHGGMGYVEETGPARHYRDARIMPIYEGTTGIQAADLVGRKLANDGGAAFRSFVADVPADPGDHGRLRALADAMHEVASWMLQAPIDDRLAGSYPFMTMTAVLVAGWTMAIQARAAVSGDARADEAFLRGKLAETRYQLDCLAGEALGLHAAAMAGAEMFYDVGDEALAA